MAELKRIDKAECESKKLRDLEFKDFPLEQFSDAGRVANEGDPHLKAAANTKLYDLEKHTIQIDIDKHKYQNSSDNTDDNSSQSADDNSSPSTDENTKSIEVSHVQLPTVGDKYHVDHDDNTLRKTVYGPTYVPYNEDGQKLLLPQTTDMSHKDNLKLLYNSLPEGMCDNEYKSLEQGIIDFETFQYSHETSTKHVVVQGVYVGSASPLIANIKTQAYSILTYMDDGMMTGTYDNMHDIPIYVDKWVYIKYHANTFLRQSILLTPFTKGTNSSPNYTHRKWTCESTFLDRRIAQCPGVYGSVQTTHV